MMEAPRAKPRSPPQKYLENDQSSVLKKFAQLLGTNNNKDGNSSDNNRTTGLLNMLVPGDDGIVLTMPSLDMKLADVDSEASLPAVGQHHVGGDTSPRPNMSASVLSLASDKKVIEEHKVTQNIGKRTSWTRSTVGYCSTAMESNLSEAFSTLLNSRLKAWTVVLLRDSLQNRNGQSRSRLLNMLSAKIKVKSAETSFKTLPLPESAAGAKPKDADVILPLLFEVILTVIIQEKEEAVTLRAPGTVSAIFEAETSSALKRVNVQIDTSVLYKSMVQQVRIVVLKAVAFATNTPVNLPKPNPGSPSQQQQQQQDESRGKMNATALGSLQSAVNLGSTAADQSARLQKARSSALRLNSVLHGKVEKQQHSTTSLGIRKVQSVRFDNPVQSPALHSALAPNPKKLRMAQTAARLKSHKSFGRPHAGDFGSGPRNATFSEYGRPGVAIWGRDGRLAQHPTPAQGVAPVDSMGNLSGGSADRNATFDFSGKNNNNAFKNSTTSPNRSAAASAGAALLGRSLSSSPTGGVGMARSPSTSLPRTATAMENSLMKKFTSGYNR